MKRAWQPTAWLVALPGCLLIDYAPVPHDAATGTVDAVVPAPVDAGQAVADAAAPDADVGVAPAPVCVAGQWCSYQCGGAYGACAFTCREGEQCEVRCEGPAGCTGVTCEARAICALYCADSNKAQCDASCSDGSTECGAGPKSWCGGCAPLPASAQ